ncbi:MAG: beta-galactosidase [Nitrospirota bacterium]
MNRTARFIVIIAVLILGPVIATTPAMAVDPHDQALGDLPASTASEKGRLQPALPVEGATQAPAIEEVRGVYSLLRGNKPVEPGDFDSPHIAGIVVRSQWKAIEPKEDDYRWDYFDHAIEEAKKAGKTVMLSVMPGAMTPEWVYEKGAKRFHFKSPGPRGEGGEHSMPIPWDEVFLKEWTDFIRAFGRRYAHEPSVVFVAMAGGASTSVEMHLPKSPDGIKKLEEAGYTKEHLVASWKKAIDAWAAAFPNQGLGLPAAVPLRRDGALEAIMDYAVAKLGRRVYLATGSLSEKTNLSDPMIQKIREYADRAGIGFQMLSSATRGGGEGGQRDYSMRSGSGGGMGSKSGTKKGGMGGGGKGREGRPGGGGFSQHIEDLRAAFEIGIKAGASWIQVYQEDIKNPSHEDDIRYLSERLKKG